MPRRRGTLVELVEELLSSGAIQTTAAQAEQCQRLVEQVLVLAEQDTPDRRRQVMALLARPDLVDDVFSTEVKPAKTPEGRYSRVVRLASPSADGDAMAVVELPEA